MNRRGFLTGLLAAPAVITTPGLLMPVRAWAEQPMFVDCAFSGAMSVFFGNGTHDDTASIQAAIDAAIRST